VLASHGELTDSSIGKDLLHRVHLCGEEGVSSGGLPANPRSK
jgi:hypothetical protein